MLSLNSIRAWIIAPVLLLVASSGWAAEPTPTPPPTTPTANFEKDRAAILSMAGAYAVRFNFRETLPLATDYELHEPHESGASELVEVVEDSGKKIVLQHILVVGDDEEKRVVKHWRQEWVYENPVLYEFRGFNRWIPRRLSPDEAAGTWTQRVFQVDDSPRYEGYGKWVHRENLVYWESNETWRPLPRREHTTRDDYDVLVARNRHTLTPTGWIHEQDNYKLVLDPRKPRAGQALAREIGLNTYDRVEPDVVAKAREYWEQSKEFWADVRAYWEERFASGQPLELRPTVDDEPLYAHLGDYLDKLRDDGKLDDPGRKARIAQIIDRFILAGAHQGSTAIPAAASGN